LIDLILKNQVVNIILYVCICVRVKVSQVFFLLYLPV